MPKLDNWLPHSDNWLPSSDNWLTESDNWLPESDNCTGNTVVVVDTPTVSTRPCGIEELHAVNISIFPLVDYCQLQVGTGVLPLDPWAGL